MNKAVKEALAKGKVLRAELDKKAEEEAKRLEDEQLAKEAAEKIWYETEAERYVSYLPEYLANAVSRRSKTFTLMSYESDQSGKFHRLAKLLEPRVTKMGLEYRYTNSSHWVQLTYDPDTGYDATYYQFDILVPEVD